MGYTVTVNGLVSKDFLKKETILVQTELPIKG
jgi:hypothetical protein